MTIETLIVFVLIALLIMSVIFAGSETAFLTSNKTLMDFKSRQLSGSFKKLSEYLRNPESFLVVILIGNNVIAVTFTTIATIELEKTLNPQLTWLVITLIILFIGELIPKSVFRNISNRILPVMVPIIWIFSILFRPLIWVVEQITLLFFKLLKISQDEMTKIFTRKELKDIILSESDFESRSEDKGDILKQLFELERINIRSIMVPRTEMVCLAETSQMDDIRSKFMQSEVSRILIYKEDIDDVFGYVHFHDFLFNNDDWMQSIYPLLIFPETKKLGAALAEFKKKKENIAAVIDEHGGIEGLVTLEDILENILGEIRDEFDFKEENIMPLKNNCFLVNAYSPVIEVNQSLHLNIPESEEYQSISGYVLKSFGRIPKLGDELIVDNMKIIVIKVMRTGVKLLRFEPLEAE